MSTIFIYANDVKVVCFFVLEEKEKYVWCIFTYDCV